MKQIVECVANFSEGRRAEVIDQIVEAIAGVDGVIVLDRQSDADHNRSVITFVGGPDVIGEAAFRAIAAAARLIDLEQHRGEHPRIGATDVVPFVPIEGVTMEDCVAIARALGQRVGDELGIPVYLYEAAATRPERQNLANLRKGEYEGLKEAIRSDPDRAPDFGPAALGSAGATVIGARPPLIAYNVYLNTANVEIARQIARAIRHSTGGLRYVKALGLLVEGQAQVSMNLTDYTQTSIYHAVEMIRREAARYGATITRSEVIGLVPQRALFDAAQWYLQIDGFKPAQVLEVRLAEAQAAAGEPPFLEALAAGTASPGGGSAAAYGGAMAAALVGMVARLTVGRRKYAAVEERMQAIIAEADDLRAGLEAAVKRDAEAFTAVMEAFRLPKDSEEQAAARDAAITQATIYATEVPLETARMAGRVLTLAAEVAEMGNSNAISDAGSAGALAAAALHAAAMNVRINVASMSDQTGAGVWLSALAAIEEAAAADRQRLHTAIRERGGIAV
ncbi:MAG: hypothetical protein Kow00124_30950 [Anaerolineae bacterium]